MKKIDTSTWKEFSLKSLGFAIYHGKRIKKSDRIDGDTVFLTAGKENRGVVGKIGNNVELWNCPITVDMFGNTFYHDHVCSGDDNVYAFINSELNGFVKMFIASIIDAKNRTLFSYTNQFRQKDADMLSVKLPCRSNGFPDFKYMEEYMKTIEGIAISSFANLQSAKKFGVLGEIDISRWKLFQISDLFNVQKGKRLTKADMKDGNIRFIGASAINNGITAYISNDEHLHSQNTITLSYNGSIGEAFYQDEIFWASDDVNVLYPKFEMSREIAFFIIPLLKTAGKRYAFIDKWKKEDMEKSKIPLPVNKYGDPDYKYMENYVVDRLTKTKTALSELILCV